MKLTSLALLLVLAAAPPVMATTVSCPDLATAVQVGACPSEEELRYTFGGYCSDDARTYRNENDVCADYQRYRKLKNVALWEAADGNFNAYVSCDRPAAEIKGAKVSSVRVGKQGKMTLLVCGYAEDINFTHRTRAACKIETTDCKTDPAACKASCD